MNDFFFWNEGTNTLSTTTTLATILSFFQVKKFFSTSAWCVRGLQKTRSKQQQQQHEKTTTSTCNRRALHTNAHHIGKCEKCVKHSSLDFFHSCSFFPFWWFFSFDFSFSGYFFSAFQSPWSISSCFVWEFSYYNYVYASADLQYQCTMMTKTSREQKVTKYCILWIEY